MRLRPLVLALSLAVFTAVPAVWAGPPSGPPTVPRTCDGEFYNVMSNRAWMESEREMETAQKLILKPDSVLEYSCFNGILNTNASQTTFSAGNELVDWVRDPLRNYYNQNFYHPMAGGTSSIGRANVTPCNTMFQVWDFLKCHNFDEADFETFIEFAATDGRSKPLACDDPDRLNDWKTALGNSKAAIDPAQ